MRKALPVVTTPSYATETVWPELPYTDWQATAETLHRWLQVIGKIRMALSPRINHWWHVTLYLTATGLTTAPMPYGQRLVEISFDFTRHRLRFDTHDGGFEEMALDPMTVADFYGRVMDKMDRLGMPVHLYTVPSEIPNPVPFEDDTTHSAYDTQMVNRFWTVLLQSERVMQQFRARFLGKVSPVHFFWGAMDLAVTRFSGRPAPPHPSMPNLPDDVTQTAYSHEVSSAGFWPGNAAFPQPVFYSYAYPEPPNFSSSAKALPKEAFYEPALREFILPYEAVRSAQNPDRLLLSFLQATYEAAANGAHWDRKSLEATSPRI